MIFTYRYCRYKASLVKSKTLWTQALPWSISVLLCPRMLEEGSFRGKSSDFVMMFLFGALSMITFAFFVNLLFLGQAFTIMLVYVWARRNPYIRWQWDSHIFSNLSHDARMNFFGLLTFNAPYLPWVLLGFSLLLGNSVSVDLLGEETAKTGELLYHNNGFLLFLGMAVGHCYYFMEDIFPQQPGGWRILRTPHFLRWSTTIRT